MIPSFVTFKWRSPQGYRSTFRAVHVNRLAEMVRRHYQRQHRFICVTDDGAGISPDVEIVPLWSDHADVPSPHGGRFPSCYRRLRVFAKESEGLLGKRIVQMDLDSVVTGDMVPLVDRDEDFIAWGDTGPGHWGGNYNGSFIVHTAGSRSRIWDSFDPRTSPKLSQDAKCLGSDQGWITYCLGKGKEAMFRKADGVYSYRNDIQPRGGALPQNARVVFFHGRVDPWSPEAQKLDWVREHYGTMN